MSFMAGISDRMSTGVFHGCLPGSGDVDFTSGAEVGAYTHLAMALIALHDVESDGTGRAFIMRQARSWICEVERRINGIPVEELLTSLEGFDFLHRTVYGKGCCGSFMRDILHKVFQEKIKGNKKISDTDLYGAIRDRMICGDMRFLGRMLLWQSRKLGAWYSEFSSVGRGLTHSFAGLLNKAAYLLGEDLFPYAGDNETSFKRDLFSRCRLLVLDGEENDAMARLRFLRLCRRMFTPEEADIVEIKLLSALSESPSIPLFDRQAFFVECGIRPTLAMV